MDAISVRLFCSRIFELFHTSKEFITYCHVVIFPCILFMRQKYLLIFLNIYSHTNLLTGDYQSFCAFLYCMDASSQYINNIVSHTTGIIAWIFPVRVLHLQETGDYLGCRPTCIKRLMTFHPTGCVVESNYLSKEGA